MWYYSGKRRKFFRFSLVKEEIFISIYKKLILRATAVFIIAFCLGTTVFAEETASTTVMKLGSKGIEVKQLQQKLADGGFLEAKYTTGFFGPNTEEAVKKYQKANNISQTGVVAEKTLGAMYSSNKLDVSAVFRKGDESGSVKQLQQALCDLKFLDSKYVTGYFGDITENAVRAFQKKYGISQTGVAAEKTLQKINSLVNITKLDTSRTYKSGDDDNGVKALQQRLNELGYLESKYVTGYYGAITVAAVKKFQKANQITQSGTVAELTLKALNSPSAKAFSSSDSASSVVESIAKPGTLRYGDSGSKVLTLQKNLKTLGYFSDSPTGTYGNATKNAVIKFQKAHSLTADGIAGSKTLSRITAALSAKSAGKKGSTTVSTGSGATVSGYTSANMSVVNQALSSLSEAQLEDVKLIARIVKREVGGSSYKCQLAVASIIMNRVTRSKMSVSAVIYSPNQFSTANSTLKNETYSLSNYYAAIEAYMGVRPIGNCLYFCSTRVRYSCWAGKNRTFYCTIDNECFFL